MAVFIANERKFLSWKHSINLPFVKLDEKRYKNIKFPPSIKKKKNSP